MRPNKELCDGCKWSGLQVVDDDIAIRHYCGCGVEHSQKTINTYLDALKYLLIGTKYTKSGRFRPNKQFVPPVGCPFTIEHRLFKGQIPKDMRFES